MQHELTRAQRTALRWRYGANGVKVSGGVVYVDVRTHEGKAEWMPFGKLGSPEFEAHPIFSEPMPSWWQRIRAWRV